MKPLIEKAFKKQTIPNSSLLSVEDVAEAVLGLDELMKFLNDKDYAIYLRNKLKKFGEFK